MVTKIEFYSSTSYISGMQTGDFIRLREAIYYHDAAILYKTKNYALSKRTLVQEDGGFPSGLLKRVCNHLKNHGIDFSIRDNRYKPRLGYIRYTQRCPEPEAYIDQRTAVQRCLADPWGHGVVVMPTGVGKTRAIKDLIQALGVKTLIVPPSSNIKNQLFRYLSECLGEDKIGFYTKSLGCQRPVTIANIDSIRDAPPEHFIGVDAVMIDELHHSGSAGYRETNRTRWDKIYYKFGFTATNFRNDKSEQILLESVLSEEIFHMTPVEAMQKNYIVPIYPIMQTVHNLELTHEKHYATNYNKFIAENLERNEKLVRHTMKIVNMGIPSLVLVKHIQHGRDLQSAMPGSVFINGQDENSEANMDIIDAFNRKEIGCLIGTGVIGEGVDTKPAGFVALANAEKARSKHWQNIGRVVRKFPGKSVGYVLDFFDKNSKYTLNHSKARRKTYIEDFGIEPTLLD